MLKYSFQVGGRQVVGTVPQTASAQWLPEVSSGNWQLATGNWQLATGNWQLATGNWQLVTGNW
jgi:hypothetical protein